MPQLPTVEVTQAQADRILAAYRAKYSTTTTAETVTAYKKELVEHVTEVVLNHEAYQMRQQQDADRQAAMKTVESELPDPEQVT